MKYTLNSLCLLLVAIAFLSSCTDLDRNYEDMTPPDVRIESSTVCGVVSDKSGQPVLNAQVRIDSKTAKTDSAGYYILGGLKAGAYTVHVESAGMAEADRNVTIDAGAPQNVPCNVTLRESSHIASRSFRASDGGKLEITSVAGESNDKAKIPVLIEIPPHALNSDATLTLQPLYQPLTETEGSFMLVGFTLTADREDVSLSAPLRVKLTLDNESVTIVQVRKALGSKWADIGNSTEQSAIMFETTDFGTYGLFVPYTLTEKASLKAVSFTQATWDNIHGGEWLTVSSAEYIINVGTELRTPGKTCLAALLNERLADTYGRTTTSVSSKIPLDVTLPVGTRLDISGRQSVSNITLTAGGQSVTAVSYGAVNITVLTRDREDTGGSN